LRRYGVWPDQLWASRWSSWWPIRRAGVEAEASETRDSYRRAAFTAYLSAGSENQTFGEFIEGLGLGVDTPQSKQQRREATKARGLAEADKIAAADPKRRAQRGK